MNGDSNPDLGPEVARYFPGPFAALLITFGAWFAAILVMSLFGSKPDIGVLGIGQVAGFALIALIATQRIPEPQAQRIGLRGFTPSILPLLFLLLPVVFLTSELDNILREFMPVPAPPEAGAELPSLLDRTNVYGTLQRVIVIVGLAPVMEEWVFRGIIQQGLMGSMGRLPGLAFTALLFSLGQLGAVFSSSTVVSYLIVAFIHGLVLGFVRLSTGSLLASMLFHAAMSAMSLAAAYLVGVFPIEGFNTLESHTPASILLPSAFAVWVGGRGLYRRWDREGDVIAIEWSEEPGDN
jgi:membrane protease YdiL (CAAX protease family)